MSALLFLLLLQKSAAFTMNGEHFNFTMIHSPPFVNMGASNGVILPSSDWTGYLVDMIKVISHYADFTYTLQPPSGNGSSCVANGTSLEWAYSYRCGEEDTYELNYTAGYWAMYYETPNRMEQGTLFTTPFMTNNGLGLLVQLPELSFLNVITRISKPFSAELWWAIAAVIVFAAIVSFFGEHRHDADRKSKHVMESIQSHITMDSNINENQLEAIISKGGEISFDQGFLNRKALTMTFPKYFYNALTTITSHGDGGISLMENDGVSKRNLVFSASWCVLAILLLASYTANLAAILTTNALTHEVDSIVEMNQQRMTACSLAGAAYTDFLSKAFPQLSLELGNSMEEMVTKMRQGKCDAVVHTSSALLAVQNGKTDMDTTEEELFCFDDPLEVVGDPMKIGPTNMGVGISDRHAALRDVISYWITELTVCNPLQPGSSCYATEIGTNLALLLELHLQPEVCGYSKSTVDVKLGLEEFFLPFLAVLVIGVTNLIYETLSVQKLAKSNTGGVKLEDVLSLPEAQLIWRKGAKVTYLYMTRLIALFNDTDNEYRVKLMAGLEHHFARNNMELYYLVHRIKVRIKELGDKRMVMGRPYMDCLRVLLKIAVCNIYDANTTVVVVVDVHEKTDSMKVRYQNAMETVTSEDSPSVHFASEVPPSVWPTSASATSASSTDALTIPSQEASISKSAPNTSGIRHLRQKLGAGMNKTKGTGQVKTAKPTKHVAIKGTRALAAHSPPLRDWI